MVYMLFWIDTLQMFPYDDDNIECSDHFLRRQTKRAVWDFSLVTCTSPGTDRSFWMFKSVLSQRVNGFYLRRTLSAVYLFACSFHFFFPPFLLFQIKWARLEITHDAQPNKLADSCLGHSVIRWRQYHSASSQYQDQPLQLLWSHASAFPTCALSTRLLWWENACNMLVLDSPTTPHTPQCLCVTSAPAHARIPPLLSGVTKGYVPHFTAYMPYWNAKCCLIFLFLFFFWTFN